MKNILYPFKLTLLLLIIVLAISVKCSAQECVGCYDSQGHYMPKGSRWTEEYNGVTYDCVCDCKSGNGVTSTPRNSSNINTSIEADFRLMLVQSFVNFLFSDNTKTISEEDKKLREKQIKDHQIELERINAENEAQRKLKEKLAQELHEKLMALYKMLPDAGDIKEKKLLSDSFEKKSFDGDSTAIQFKGLDDASAVDLRPKEGEDPNKKLIVKDLKNNQLDSLVKKEQIKYDNEYDKWVKENNGDVLKRLERPDPYFDNLARSIKTKSPPPLNPEKKLKDLQPGDVILVGNNFPHPITGLDMLFSGTTETHSSHTLLYLKEIAGQKMFLDNQPGQGEKIITESEFLETYGSRPMEVAQLIAKPIRKDNGDYLYKNAFDLVAENEKYKYDNPYYIFTGTKYGLKDEDMVCSEADRWVMVKSGFLFPKTDDKIKKFFGLDFSPADYKSGYFYVTPLDKSSEL